MRRFVTFYSNCVGYKRTYLLSSYAYLPTLKIAQILTVRAFNATAYYSIHSGHGQKDHEDFPGRQSNVHEQLCMKLCIHHFCY